MSAASVSCFGLTSWSAIRTGEAIFLLVGLLMAVQRMLWIEQGGAGQQLSLSTTRSLYIPGSGKKVSTT
ncbi:MAG: hypothetical protein HUU14_07360 [Dehalococcoidia bacterium]|nr:hypothetical protein [Dehalococcoidia bacterium]